jgi:sulfur transfer complex TusBCD TusB component (DsrH family)
MPFQKEIYVYLVAVSEADSVVMMQDSVIMVIKDKILVQKRKDIPCWNGGNVSHMRVKRLQGLSVRRLIL